MGSLGCCSSNVTVVDTLNGCKGVHYNLAEGMVLISNYKKGE